VIKGISYKQKHKKCNKQQQKTSTATKNQYTNNQCKQKQQNSNKVHNQTQNKKKRSNTNTPKRSRNSKFNGENNLKGSTSIRREGMVPLPYHSETISMTIT
jgi:hypothetical protein